MKPLFRKIVTLLFLAGSITPFAFAENIDSIAFVDRARELHKTFYSVDTHTDTPYWFYKEGYDVSRREENQINLPKMEEGGLDAVFLAAFVSQKERDEAGLSAATEKANGLISTIYRQVERKIGRAHV